MLAVPTDLPVPNRMCLCQRVACLVDEHPETAVLHSSAALVPPLRLFAPLRCLFQLMCTEQHLHLKDSAASAPRIVSRPSLVKKLAKTPNREKRGRDIASAHGTGR